LAGGDCAGGGDGWCKVEQHYFLHREGEASGEGDWGETLQRGEKRGVQRETRLRAVERKIKVWFKEKKEKKRPRKAAAKNRESRGNLVILLGGRTGGKGEGMFDSSARPRKKKKTKKKHGTQ